MINAVRLKELRSQLRRVSVPERDRIVLSVHFGSYDGIYRSATETAKIFNMTHQGVGYIEQKFYRLIKSKSMK